jgi:hydrogenase expression/formation protein HypC
VALDGDMATVEAFGQTRRVSLLLLSEPVAVGDYLLIQASGFAFERIAPDHAQASLRMMQELMAHDGADVRAWQ